MSSSSDCLKTPLTSTNSGSSVFTDRNSPISMSELLRNEELLNSGNHDYACPEEILKDIRLDDPNFGMKKRNLLYEPVTTKTKENGFKPLKKSDDLHYDKRNDGSKTLYTTMFVLTFLLALGAFVLSTLTSFGIIQGACNRCSKDEVYPVAYAAYSQNHRTIDDAKKLLELENNITYLSNHVLPALLGRLENLKTELNNQSSWNQIGPQGPPGPAGAGDMSKCQYKTRITSATSYDAGVTAHVSPTKGFTILGVTCSGGSESALYQENFKGQTFYRCKCVGKPSSLLFAGSQLKCQAHFWQCPDSS